MKHEYRAWEVDGEEYSYLPLGASFKGGVVVDGICDTERNVMVIVTRHVVSESAIERTRRKHFELMANPPIIVDDAGPDFPSYRAVNLRPSPTLSDGGDE